MRYYRTTGLIVRPQPDAAYEGADEASANRDLWTQVSRRLYDEHAFRAWAASEITWGIFNIPEAQLDVLDPARWIPEAARLSAQAGVWSSIPPPSWSPCASPA